jgi:hypothetical protein
MTIRVPRAYLSDVSREEITRRRAVYGTDIYTDDSDVIAACIHQGWFRGAWAPDVDTSYLDLEIGDRPTEPINVESILTSPPPSGPWIVPKNHDADIKILVLPALEEYKGCVRFGIRSREWGVRHEGYKAKHDGLSFKIMSVQFIGGQGGISHNKKRGKKAYSQKLSPRELEEEERTARAFDRVNAVLQAAAAEQSFERGGHPNGLVERGDITGVGSKSWNLEPPPLPPATIIAAAKQTQYEGEEVIEEMPLDTRLPMQLPPPPLRVRTPMREMEPPAVEPITPAGVPVVENPMLNIRIEGVADKEKETASLLAALAGGMGVERSEVMTRREDVGREEVIEHRLGGMKTLDDHVVIGPDEGGEKGVVEMVTERMIENANSNVNLRS